MTDRVELSVVIPCRNVESTLGDELEALSSQRAPFPWEVVVVDNGSTDGTVTVAESFADRLRLRVVPCGIPGINPARNAGIRAAESDHVALCDGDDVVADGWVDAMGRALRDHDYVTGPVELDRLNPPDLADSRGRASAATIPSFGRAFRYARGCNLGINRTVLADVGWFADEAPYPFDDQELGMRMARAGVALHFEPTAVVHYRYRAGARAIWRQGVSYGFNRVELYRIAKRSGFLVPWRLSGWRSWAWLVVNLPRLRTRAGRLALLWVLANRLGQVAGSVRWRTVFL